MNDSDNIIKFPGKAKLISVKTDKAYVAAEKVTVSRKKEPPNRTDVKTPLTNEHREELRNLVNDWVTTSNLAKKPLNHAKAYTKLYADGLNGEVNGIEQIEESEFEQCRRYLQQRIKILETVGDSRVIRRKSEWRRDRIGKIHSICKTLGVSDETRKAYQLARYGKDSLADFTDDELEDFYRYVIHGTPKFKMPRAQAKTIQQDRENALRVLIGVLEANAKEKEQIFNPFKLTITKDEMRELLIRRNRDLFIGDDGNEISIDQFNDFWKAQKICKCKSGRRLGSGTQ